LKYPYYLPGGVVLQLFIPYGENICCKIVFQSTVTARGQEQPHKLMGLQQTQLIR